MAQAQASVLGQAQMNVSPAGAGASGIFSGSTHVWTWGLLIFLLLILVVHYWGMGGIRGSVAS